MYEPFASTKYCIICTSRVPLPLCMNPSLPQTSVLHVHLSVPLPGSPYVWILHLHKVVYYIYISECPSPAPPMYEPFTSTKYCITCQSTWEGDLRVYLLLYMNPSPPQSSVLLLYVDGEVISGCPSPSLHIYYISNVNMCHKAACRLAILPEIYL